MDGIVFIDGSTMYFDKLLTVEGSFTMRKTIIRVIISLLLAITLVINLASMSYSKVDVSKISNKLMALMRDNSDKLPVSIWLATPDISREQEIVQTAVASLSVEAELGKITKSDLTRQSSEIKKEYRADVSKVYLQANNSFASSRLADESIVYISKYSPTIIANLSKSEILTLSKYAEVVSIDYYEEVEYDTSFSIYSEQNYGMIETNRSTYTAEGINIGFFDSCVPSQDEIEALGVNVIDTYGTYETGRNHAYTVASVAAELVPDANYYFTGNMPGASSRECIEWLLTQGVDVINMSIGFAHNSTYDSLTKWYDHIAYNHYVLFVVAAGNQSGVVMQPAMAYNVMTVGAMKKAGVNWVYDAGSSYYSGNVYASKPDIVAKSTSSTSCAAPLITAAAAILIKEESLLTYTPETLKAILAASVDTTTQYHYTPDNRVNGANIVTYMQAGAGVLDIDNALELVTKYQSRATYLSTNKVEQTYSFTISNSDIGSIVRIAMAYNIPVDATNDHSNETVITYAIPNLDLAVCTPNSSVANYSSTTTQSNVEIVEFIPQVAGTYIIRIYTISGTAAGKNIYFGVAWSIQ